MGVACGILLTCLGILRSSYFQPMIAFLAPNNRVESSYLLLPAYAGIEMIALSFLFLAYALFGRQMDHLFRRAYHPILLLLCGVLVLLAFSTSIHRWLGPDEFEHVHSAWYITAGYRPYTDFFQLHHPLLWYFLAPFLRVFGCSVHTVLILRMVMFLFAMGIAYSTYLISQRMSLSKDAGLFSVILLLSVVMFVERAIEIRPDVPQVFFGMISIYALMRYFQSKNLKDIVIAAITCSLSFMFLQKTIFLLIAYAGIFAFRFLKGQTSLRPLLWFSVSFCLPLSFFLTSVVLMSGSLRAYYITTVALNIDRSLVSFSPFVNVKAALVLNCLFWMLAFFSLAYTLVSKRMSEDMKLLTFIGATLLFSVFLVKHPYEQYFMQAIPLLSVVIGGSFDSLQRKYNLTEAQKLTVVLVVIAIPILWLSFLGLRNTNGGQLEKANYVLRNSGESDLIYDGSNQFNLYRRDLHYFWYNFEKLPVFNRLTDGKFADYDACTLIRSKQPAFISDYGIDMKKCWLDEVYEKTGFEGLFVRKKKHDSFEPGVTSQTAPVDFQRCVFLNRIS